MLSQSISKTLLLLTARELTNGRAAGASGMRAKHVKAWLRGIQREEDPKDQGADGAGDNWRLFIRLVQAAWTHGITLRQLYYGPSLGAKDYRGTGLLEPIWKCIEQVIGHRLNAIELHDSLHGCRDKRGTSIDYQRQTGSTALLP